MTHPEIDRMDPAYRYRLRAELDSMTDPRWRVRYQGNARRIRGGVRSLLEFRSLSDAAIDAVATDAGLLP